MNSLTYTLGEEEKLNERNTINMAFAGVGRVQTVATSQLQGSLLTLIITINLSNTTCKLMLIVQIFFLNGTSGFFNLRLLSKLPELPSFLQSCQLLCYIFRVNSIISKLCSGII